MCHGIFRFIVHVHKRIMAKDRPHNHTEAEKMEKNMVALKNSMRLMRNRKQPKLQQH